MTDTFIFEARRTPDALNYAADFTPWLDKEGTTIASQSVTVVKGDLVVSGVHTDGGIVRLRLTGGTSAVPVQRLAITITTGQSPPQIRDIEANITILS